MQEQAVLMQEVVTTKPLSALNDLVVIPFMPKLKILELSNISRVKES